MRTLLFVLLALVSQGFCQTHEEEAVEGIFAPQRPQAVTKAEFDPNVTKPGAATKPDDKEDEFGCYGGCNCWEECLYEDR